MNELLTNFGVDWKLLLAQMVNFAILLYLLKRFAYGPVLGMLEKRRGIVEKGLRDASEAEKSLVNAEKTAQEIHAQAKTNAEALVEEANSKAMQYVARAKEEGEVARNKIVAEAAGEVERLKKENEKMLAASAVKHIVSGVRAILREEVTEEMNGRIVSKLTQ